MTLSSLSFHWGGDAMGSANADDASILRFKSDHSESHSIAHSSCAGSF